jgi:hypothetical protein
MTPKEKAEELVNNYKTIIESFLNPFFMHSYMQDVFYFSKNCATTAVDEIIKLDDFSIEGREYWENVKKEIELL